MSFLRRSKSKRPKPESYQERLRAIGRRLDDDGLRFGALIELPEGFVLKAEELAARGAGEAGTWTSRTIWLDDDEISTIIDAGFAERGEKRDRR